jgi:hypothetical protein
MWPWVVPPDPELGHPDPDPPNRPSQVRLAGARFKAARSLRPAVAGLDPDPGVNRQPALVAWVRSNGTVTVVRAGSSHLGAFSCESGHRFERLSRDSRSE